MSKVYEQNKIRKQPAANPVLTPQDEEHLKTLQQGIDLQREHKFQEAEFRYQLVLRDNPNHPDANNLMGTLAVEADALDIAKEYFQKALKAQPKNPVYRNNLGNLYVSAGEPGNAIPHLRKAIGLQPGFIEPIVNLARAYKKLGRANLAYDFFKRAVKLQPEHPLALFEYGEVLTNLGKMKQAVKVFKECIKHGVSVVESLHNLTVIHKFSDDDDDSEIELIEKMIEGDVLEDGPRISLHHSAGKILSDLKRHDKAFAHYSKAKDIAGEKFDIAEHQNTYDRLISLFTPTFFAERAHYGVKSERPVFIVGMPRSGTTLTEQISASHPMVYGAGEMTNLRGLIDSTSDGAINPEAFAHEISNMTAEKSVELAQQYLDALKRHSKMALRVTDKLPHNFELLGFIALLFPNAKVVHCRRSPLDNCVSCFTHKFSDFHGYNSNLSKLGLYYREYDRLMQHWQKVLPMKVYENQYEKMTSNQEVQTRKLINYLGLDWDDQCLAFFETKRLVQTPSRWQVRQPIYTSSVKSWQKYEAHLGPLIDALGDLAQ